MLGLPGTLRTIRSCACSFPRRIIQRAKLYSLILSGSPGNNVSTWGYSLDVYDGGVLAQIGGDQSILLAQDLRFVTRYDLTWP